MAKLSPEQLEGFSKGQIISMYVSLQDQMDLLNKNMEALAEQIRLANAHRFGRKTEKLAQIEGQMSLFNEAETLCNPDAPEPSGDEVVISVRKKRRKGQREEDLKDLPHEPYHHILTDRQLDAFFGPGCWRRMKSVQVVYK